MNTNTSLLSLAVAWTVLVTAGVHIMARADEPKAPVAGPQPSVRELQQKLQEYTLQPQRKDDRNTYKVLSGELRAVADKDLESLLDSTQNDANFEYGFELCLTEIARRGGDHWETALKNLYAKNQNQLRAAGDFTNGMRVNDVQLPILTALRRVQKKSDPLTILVAGKSYIHCTLSQLPDIAANITNLDAEREPLSVEVGGDYRGSTRHNKWRIEVHDADGRRLPELNEFDMGGFGGFEKLQYAESIPNTLQISSYVMIGEPGKYTLTVMYHPQFGIGNLEQVDGLICCKSATITLVIEPVRIATTKVEQAQAASLIQKLPARGTVKVLGGMYVETMSDFMPKDSPAAQLIQMDWNAVPELIKAVNGNQLNSTQKAWVLGLLFNITGLRNPLDDPTVVGDYDYRYSGRNRRNGTFGGSIQRSFTGGAINERAQSEFAKGWKPWIDRDYVKIEYVDGEKVRFIPLH